MSNTSFPKIQCNNCKDIISSSYEGEFVTCECYYTSKQHINRIYQEILNESADGQYVEIADPETGFVEQTDDGHRLCCDLSAELGTGIYIDSTSSYSRYGGPGCSPDGAGFTPIEDEDDEQE
jgi:hypothetical protein